MGSTTHTYRVPGVSCGHCQVAITEEVTRVAGVESVMVDLEAKLVQIDGHALDNAALIAAIDEAGYDAEPASAERTRVEQADPEAG